MTPEEQFVRQKLGIFQEEHIADKVREDDEGTLAFRIGTSEEKQVVIVDFPKPITFIAMSPQDAVNFAKVLIKNASSISKNLEL